MSASPESRHPTLPAVLLVRLQRALLPARRVLSRAVLVYEERHFRELAVKSVYAALSAEAAKIRDDLRALEERVILRADIVMEELWRRTEAVGARQTTELQRLSDRVGELQREAAEKSPQLTRLVTQMSEVHRLATEIADIRRLAGNAAGSGLLIAELERGLPIPPEQRLEPYLKYFQHLAPVLDLRAGAGDFSRLASAAGIEVAGLPAESAPTDYLAALQPAALGGLFCDHVVDTLPDCAASDLLRAARQALEPAGIAIVETANPSSLARRLAAERTRCTLRTPDQLAALATDAGLEVDECRFGPQPSRHLNGVTPGATDPAIQEVADGINALVAQLNELLYGPQDYALILHRPVLEG